MKRNVSEQYRRELLNEEIKSNKRTLKGFIWFLVALTFMWLLTAVGIFVISLKLITIAYVMTIVIVVPSFLLWKEGSLSKPWVKYYLLTLICIVSGVIASFLSYHAVFVYVFPLLFAIQYRRKSTIWYAYVVNMITMFISMVVCYYYGICDLNLLLGYQNTRKWFMERVVDGTLTMPLNKNILFILIVFAQFPRSIVFFVFSVMMQYAIVGSNEDAYRIAQLTYMKETDVNTRVFNKGKYEEMVKDYYPGIEWISVTFWDLNNLKMLNDERGHEVGDKAINTLSSLLYRYEDDRKSVFRIGGDEFLVITNNPQAGETEQMVKEIKQNLKQTEEGKEFRLSCAAGIAYGRGADIIDVVKEADGHMYIDKKESKGNV